MTSIGVSQFIDLLKKNVDVNLNGKIDVKSYMQKVSKTKDQEGENYSKAAGNPNEKKEVDEVSLFHKFIDTEEVWNNMTYEAKEYALHHVGYLLSQRVANYNIDEGKFEGYNG